MRTLHVGLRVEDLERSLAFYTALGYNVVGTVPDTAFGSLTMLTSADFAQQEPPRDARPGR